MYQCFRKCDGRNTPVMLACVCVCVCVLSCMPRGTFIHAISPQVWSRMREEERDADYLIKNGMLDKIEDIEVDGEKIPASVLGYRINAKFVNTFFGRVFQNPSIVFDEDMLKPELQVTAGCVCDGMRGRDVRGVAPIRRSSDSSRSDARVSEGIICAYVL